MDTFKKLKAAGLPKASARFAKLKSAPKLPSFKIKQPKNIPMKTPKDFNFAKFIKTPKLKNQKMSVLKKAVKAKKPIGY